MNTCLGEDLALQLLLLSLYVHMTVSHRSITFIILRSVPGISHHTKSHPPKAYGPDFIFFLWDTVEAGHFRAQKGWKFWACSFWKVVLEINKGMLSGCSRLLRHCFFHHCHIWNVYIRAQSLYGWEEAMCYWFVWRRSILKHLYKGTHLIKCLDLSF